MNRLQMIVAARALLAAAFPSALAGTAVRANDSTVDAATTVDYPVTALRGLTRTGFVRAQFRGVAWKASASSFAIVSVDDDVTDQNTPGNVTVSAQTNCLATENPDLLHVVSTTAKSKGVKYLEGLTIGADHAGSAVGPV